MNGRDGEYWWADRLGEAWRILKQFPEIVIGRRVVIASFDSGPLRVSDEEAQRGWSQHGDIAVTSVISSYEDIVGGVSDEGTELWLYEADGQIPDFSTWSHLGGEVRVITLADPEVEHPDGPATWDPELLRADREQLTRLQDALRHGLSCYRPLTFLRNDLVVSRDPMAIAALQAHLATAATCPCPSRSPAAWVRPSPADFTAPWDLIERSEARWNALFRCRMCGAYWVVEQGAEYNRDTNVAMRIESARQWDLADLTDARRQLLVDAEGESSRPCRWTGCPRRALKDREVCVDHAYGLTPPEQTSEKS